METPFTPEQEQWLQAQITERVCTLLAQITEREQQQLDELLSQQIGYGTTAPAR